MMRELLFTFAVLLTFSLSTCAPDDGIPGLDLAPWARESYWLCEITYNMSFTRGSNSNELMALFGVEAKAPKAAAGASDAPRLGMKQLLRRLRKSRPRARMARVRPCMHACVTGHHCTSAPLNSTSFRPPATPLPQVILPPASDVEAAEAAAPAPSARALPRLIHMTVPDTRRLHPKQALSIASWVLLNPGHSLLVYGDSDVRAVVARHFPQHLALLDGLPSAVERTDMWRYLVR